MRFAATLLFAFAASPLLAADKDEVKAKEAAAAFMKAVRAKDVEAVMKVVDVPFTFGGTKEPIDKVDQLRRQFSERLKAVNPDKVPDTIGEVLDVPSLRKLLEATKEEERAPEDVEALKVAEKVKGDAVFVIALNKGGFTLGGVIVRVQDGKASVVESFWVVLK
jgi:ketosteroid isomerase-like protein